MEQTEDNKSDLSEEELPKNDRGDDDERDESEGSVLSKNIHSNLYRSARLTKIQ